jgi:parallel beta-helix repeat protein
MVLGYDGTTYPTTQELASPTITGNVIRGSNHGGILVGSSNNPIIANNILSDLCRVPKIVGNDPSNWLIDVFSCSNPVVAYNIFQGTAQAKSIGTYDGSSGGTLAANTGISNFVGNVNFLDGASIDSGTGAPATAPDDGSIYLRTDGGVSTTLYVRQSGAWVGVVLT